MDIKKIIEDAVNKLKGDEALKKQFLSNPAGALKKLTGIDIPTDQIEKVVAGIKAKLTADNVGDAVKGLGNLFKK
ncbi:MAG: hypothetical protein K2J60_02440 [Acetatifactor sp.]|nr:hypothetical protein [Acetatifactor sp.]